MDRKKLIISVAVLVLIFCLSWSKNTDFSQDLGRHLKLGEIIVKTGSVPSTNLFSYTNPDFPFVNHHWLSEMVFYLLVSFFGLPSLFFLRFLLFAGAVYFAWKSAVKHAHYLIAALTILVLSPLLLERIGIRPELFGYFFFTVVLYTVLFQKNLRVLYILPFVMAAWANTHISFVFGLFVIGIGILLSYKDRKRLLILLSGIAAVLLNPHGFAGAVEPFVIFRNYGYSIVENQTVFFLNSITFKPLLRYYLMLIPFVFAAAVILLAKKRMVFVFILAVFFAAGFWQIRHISFFVFTGIPVISCALNDLRLWLKKTQFAHRLARYPYDAVMIVLLCGASLFVVSNVYYRTYDDARSFGYGYIEEEKGATDFILRNKLPGNIFNNFDIGGYAIYRLYPAYRMFVDNRPEAYPSDFFQKVYIPMQQDDAFRKQVFKQYGIHTVLFSHTDMTPWGRDFMKNIISDPSWKLVYANTEMMVLTDAAPLPDIRQDTSYFQNLITAADEPTALLTYSYFLSLIGADEQVRQAMLKAKSLNPLSCAVRRMDYAIATNPELFFTGIQPERSWWCY